jgi:hypothetical protein
MKLAIVEPSKSGAEHLSFNRCVIQALRSQPGLAITLFCGSSHFDALETPVEHVEIPVVSIVSRRFIRKAAVEALAVWRALVVARRRGIRRAVFLSLFPPLLGMLPLAARLLGISVTLILHGELEGLVDPRRQKPTSYGFWTKRFFERRGFTRVRCLVLGEGIHARLTALYPAAAGIAWANHPLTPGVPAADSVRDVLIASVGVATQRKHAALFEAFRELHVRRGIRAAHVGMTESALYERFRDAVDFTAAPGEHLSRTAFEATLSRTTTAVFPYADDSYRLTVSGAMLDALARGCHVVSLDNAFARDLRRDGWPVTIAPDVRAIVDATRGPVEATPDLARERYSSAEFAKRLRATLESSTQ